MPELIQGLVDAVGIRDGKQCRNRTVDQERVMALLNRISVASGGTLTAAGPIRFKAPHEGVCDPAFSQQIRNLQQTNRLAVVDGVVDPGGTTFRLMERLAAQGEPAPNASGEQKELELFDNADVLSRLLGLLTAQHAKELGPTLTAKLQTMKADLERMIRERKLPPRPQKPLPVQNNAGVLVIGVAVVVIVGLGIIAISVDPAFRKAAGRTADGIIKKADEAAQAIELFKLDMFGTLADGIAKINQLASTKVQQGCRADFLEFD
jgi:hypothetical protein